MRDVPLDSSSGGGGIHHASSSDYLLSRWGRANYTHGSTKAYGAVLSNPPSRDATRHGKGDGKTQRRQNSAVSIGSIAEDVDAEEATALAAAE
mmetsp:Transcript_24743/g.34561  ORF Transcript_24743/g.34561 Transcript_24743/m.34561 type:complete len:93 (-) Transcript_24743:241-519(-)